jgi:hypothetical protein
MPNDHKSGPTRSAASTEISKLIRAYGVTRDQARRLINTFGNNRAKLSEAAQTLKARSPAPGAALQSNGSMWGINAQGDPEI